MEVFEAVRTVLAVREYRDKPIPTEVVRKIVEAAHLSPSAANKQPWHFIVVEDKGTLRRLGELAKTGPYIAGAALTVVVCIEKASRMAVSDASRAVQSMVLTAWEEGVGSNWAGFVGMLEDAAELLGVPPEYDVLAILPFGYPIAAVGKGKKTRKPLAEVVSRERYGESFA